MKLVGVNLKKVRVDSFSVINDSVVLEIFFNDGYDKQIFRTTDVSNPKQLAQDILKDITRMECNINVKFDGEKVSGESRVVMNDETEKIKKLTHFLDEVSAKMQKIKNKKSSTGYLDLLRDVRQMEVML